MDIRKVHHAVKTQKVNADPSPSQAKPNAIKIDSDIVGKAKTLKDTNEHTAQIDDTK